MRAFTNLKNWNFNLGKYPMDKTEAEEVLRSVRRDQPMVLTDYKCPNCEKPLYERVCYCPGCGQRVIYKSKNTL
jgi:DNA-directed RNA polymerase subunit RPC12/RpoP